MKRRWKIARFELRMVSIDLCSSTLVRMSGAAKRRARELSKCKQKFCGPVECGGLSSAVPRRETWWKASVEAAEVGEGWEDLYRKRGRAVAVDAKSVRGRVGLVWQLRFGEAGKG